MNIQAGAATETAKLDLTEWEALDVEAVNDPELKAALATFETGSADSRQVPCKDLASATDCLLRRLDTGLRAVIYSIYCTPMPGLIPPGSSSGVAGARVGDELYEITGGVNQCTLERFRQNEKGEWEKIAVEDARHLTTIKTDNMGDIKIRKRSKAGTTTKWLRRIQKMLQGLPPDLDVIVTVG